METEIGGLLRRRYLPGLDGLRAIGMLIVVVYHFNTAWLPGADLIMSMFFVVSGFLITWIMRKEVAETGAFSVRTFFRRRILRIFPAYYAFIVVTALVLIAVGQSFRPRLWVALVTYNVDFFAGFIRFPGWVGHAWTLGIEEKFYVLWPIGFLYLALRGAGTLRRGIVGVIVAVLAWRTFLVFSGLGTAAHLTWTFDTRIDNIAIGCLLAAVADTAGFARIAKAATRSQLLPLVTIAAILVSRYVISSPMESGAGVDRYHETIGLTIEGFLWALLVVQLMLLADRPLWNWLNTPVARHISRLSYSIYLYHLLGLFVGQLVTPFPLAQLGVGLVATYALANISYHFVERPFQRIRDRPQPIAATVPVQP